MNKSQNNENNYLFLCGSVNFIGAIAFVINPLLVFALYVFFIALAYKIPDIILEPFDLADLIWNSIYTFLFCLLFFLFIDLFDFSRIKALMLCMPILIGKEIWFYLKYLDLAKKH